jgi:HEAT repeats
MRIARAVAIGTLLSVGPLVSSGPVPQFDLRAAFERAGIVIIGRVGLVISGGSKLVTVGQEQVAGHEKHALVTVLEQLKGPATPSEITVSYGLPDAPSGVANIVVGSRLLFLSKHGAQYEVADPYYPSVPAQPPSERQPEAGLERAAVAIASLISNPSADPGEKVLALSALEGGLYPRALDLIRPATKDDNAAVQIGAMVDLVEAGDGIALQQACSVLLGPGTGVPGYLLHNLTYAVSIGRFVSGNVDALSLLLKAPEAETRRAAAQALWHVSDLTALKPLSSALSDGDSEVRYYAVRGLAELANQPEWTPSIPEFESNENRYLQHWKEWAAQH